MNKQPCGVTGVPGALARQPVGKVAGQDEEPVTDLPPRSSAQDDPQRSRSVETHVQVSYLTKVTNSKNLLYLLLLKSCVLCFAVVCKLNCTVGRPSKDCSYCICQGPTLHGEVLSVTGVPVAGATVALANQTKIIRAQTDAQGHFKIDELCSTLETKVIVSKEKFAPVTVPVFSNTTDTYWVQAILRSSGRYIDRMNQNGNNISISNALIEYI